MKNNIKILLVSLCAFGAFFPVQVAGELAPVQPGRGYLFDGVDDYVDLGNNADFALQDFRIELGSKKNTDGVYYGIISLQADIAGGTANGVILRYNSTNTISAIFSINDAFEIITTTDTFATNVYRTITLAKSGTSVSLLVDGIEKASGTLSSSAITYDNSTTKTTLIGAYNSGGGTPSFPIDGYIGNVKIYDGNDKLIHSWHMDEGDGTTSYDSVREWEGSDIASNGTFDSDVSGYTISRCTTSWNAGGYVTVTATENDNFAILGSGVQVIGKRYRISYRAKSNDITGPSSINSVHYDDLKVIKMPNLAPQWQEYVFEGVAKTVLVIYASSHSALIGESVDIDDIVIKELNSPSHGTITNADVNTFHTTNNDFKSYQNDVGYSEEVPTDTNIVVDGDCSVIPQMNTTAFGTGRGSNSIQNNTLKFTGDGVSTGTKYIRVPITGLQNGESYLKKFRVFIPASNTEIEEISFVTKQDSAYFETNRITTKGEWVDVSTTFTYSGVPAFDIIGTWNYDTPSSEFFFIDDVEYYKITEDGLLIPLLYDQNENPLKKDVFGNDATYTGRNRTNAKLIGNNVMVFDGVDDLIETSGSSSKMNPGAGDFTVSAVIETLNEGTYHSIVKKQSAYNAGWTFYFATNGEIGLYLGGDTGDFYARSGAGFLDIGGIHEVTAVVQRDATTTVKFYADGVLVATDNTTIALGAITSTSPVIFASEANGGWSAFKGKMSDFRYYDRALAAEEVADIDAVTSGLISNYSLSEGSGKTVYDRVPTWYGDNFVTNGEFITDSDWTKETDGTSGNNWIIASGKALHTGIASTGSPIEIYQTVNLRANVSYRVSFDVALVSGSLRFGVLGDTEQLVVYTTYTPGHYTFTVTPSANRTNIQISASQVAGIFSVDNFSVEELHEPANGTVTNADLDTFWATDMDVRADNLLDGYTAVAGLNGVDDTTLITNGTTLGGERLVVKLKTESATRQAVFAGAFDTTEIVYFHTDGAFGSGTATTSGIATTESFNDGAWHIFDITKNATNDYTILVDGTDYSGGTSSGYRITNAVGLAYSSAFLPFDGEIQYATVYNSGGTKLIDLHAIGDGAFRDKVANKTYASDGAGYKNMALPPQSGETGLDINGSHLTHGPQDMRHAALAYKHIGTFDGVDDWVNAGNDIKLDITSAITLETWVKPNSYDIHYPLFLSKGSNIYRIGLQEIGDGKVFFRLTLDEVIQSLGSSSVVPIGEWTHVVGTYDGSFMKIYINGVLNGSASAQTGTIDSSTLPLVLGAYNTAGQYSFDGDISDIRIYNQGLSADEVLQRYNNKNISTGLVAHYPLSEGAGMIAYDTVPTYMGANVVTNSGFDADSDWIKGTNCTISGGEGIYASGADFPGFKQLLTGLTIGNRYRIDFDVTAYTSGYLVITPGASGSTVSFVGDSDVGHKQIDIIWDGTDSQLYVRADTGSFIGSIDNVSVQQVYEPANGTITNATVSEFWEIDSSAPDSNSYEKGFSQGLINTTAGTAYTPSEVAYGDWEFDMYKGVDGNAIEIDIINDVPAKEGGYSVYIANDESVNFYQGNANKRLGTASSYIENNTWYRTKVSRLKDEGYFGDMDVLNTSSWDEFGSGGSWSTFENNEATGIHVVRTLGAGYAYMAMDLDDQLAVTGNKIHIKADVNVVSKVNKVQVYLGASQGGYSESLIISLNTGENYIDQIFEVHDVYTTHDTYQLEFALRCGDNCDVTVSNLETYLAYPADTFAAFIKGGSFGDEYVLVDTTGGSGTNPVTDSTYTTSSYFVTDLDAGDEIANVKIGAHSASLHEFEIGTGEYDKKFIPAQSGRGIDVLGNVLQVFGVNPSTSFTAIDIARIVAQKLARVGLNYWNVTTRKFLTGQSDGSLLDMTKRLDRLLTSAELATIDTGNTAPEGHYYWDTTLRKFFRGAADNSLEDFITWFGLQ